MLEGASGVFTMMEGAAGTIDWSLSVKGEHTARPRSAAEAQPARWASCPAIDAWLAGARPGIAVSTHARMRLPTAPAPCRAPPCFQASPT